jgi:hypothetical protein
VALLAEAQGCEARGWESKRQRFSDRSPTFRRSNGWELWVQDSKSNVACSRSYHLSALGTLRLRTDLTSGTSPPPGPVKCRLLVAPPPPPRRRYNGSVFSYAAVPLTTGFLLGSAPCKLHCRPSYRAQTEDPSPSPFLHSRSMEEPLAALSETGTAGAGAEPPTPAAPQEGPQEGQPAKKKWAGPPPDYMKNYPLHRVVETGNAEEVRHGGVEGMPDDMTKYPLHGVAETGTPQQRCFIT